MSGHVHPVRAAIERHAEAAGSVTQRPPMRIARLDQREAPPRGRDLARRRDARRAGATMIARHRSARRLAAGAPSAGRRRARSAAEPARKMRRIHGVMVSKLILTPRTKFARSRDNPQTLMANNAVFVHRSHEPKRNELR